MRAAAFRFKITFTGWLFIFLSLGIGMSALNTGNNLLYLVFGMMLSFLVLSGLLSNNSLRRLEIQPIFPTRIFARQLVPVRVNLWNRKRFSPSFGISLRAVEQHTVHQGGAFVIKISPDSTASTTDHLQFPRRGAMTLPLYRVETTYPFGLIRKSFPLPSAGKTIVYPAVIPIDPWLGRQKRLQGEYLSGEKGGFINPYGLRDFVPGDPARLIHWKTSAKQQKWKVKEFEKEKRLRILLDVPLAPPGQTEPALLERAVSAAASIVLSLSRRGIEVTLRLNGEMIEAKGRGYLDAYLTALALVSSPAHSATKVENTDSNMVLTVSDLPAAKLSGDMVLGREHLGPLA